MKKVNLICLLTIFILNIITLSGSNLNVFSQDETNYGYYWDNYNDIPNQEHLQGEYKFSDDERKAERGYYVHEKSLDYFGNNTNEANSEFVYSTAHSNRYHSVSYCHLINHKLKVSILKKSTAIKLNKTPCKVCVISSQDNVWVCNGPESKRYHKHGNCQGFTNCTDGPYKLTLADAKGQGYTPCEICYGK